jgi:hypothetical protein
MTCLIQENSNLYMLVDHGESDETKWKTTFQVLRMWHNE